MSEFGQDEIQFDATEHRYYFGGNEMFGVSRIMTDLGLRKGGPWERDEVYRKRGHAVHLACRYVQEGTYSESGTHPKIVPFVRAYEDFLKQTGFKAILCEEPVYSKASSTAGTLDQFGMVGPEYWLLDLKSGTLPAGVGIQLGAYRHMLRECKGLVPDKAKAVRLEESGKFTLVDYSEQKWVNLWLNGLAIWKFRQQNGLLP